MTACQFCPPFFRRIVENRWILKERNGLPTQEVLSEDDVLSGFLNSATKNVKRGDVLLFAPREDDDASQPKPTSIGLFLVLGFGFVTGAIATVIDLEPCGLGELVETLSKGKFTKLDLFGSVSLGVAGGVVLGLLKVVYNFDLRVPLVIGYGIALALTAFSQEGIMCIAWDAAGVTTGPITVPLVLSIGTAMASSTSCKADEGFGILACASVGPIISVLVWGLYRLGPAQKKDRKEQLQVQAPQPSAFQGEVPEARQPTFSFRED